MNTIDTNAYLTAVLPNLKNYLLSSTLYSPITFGVAPFKKPMPNISIGNIYLALKCLPESNSDIEKNLLHILDNWKVAVEEKSEREITARDRQWTQLLEEWKEDLPTTASQYAYEIRIRVIIQLLQNKINNRISQELLTILDEKLRVYTTISEFVWDNEIKNNFDPENYWYLYRSIS